MNSPEKQLKYSIRKVSVGAASVVIGALYLLMGAGVAHAEDVGSAREAERTANPTSEQSGNGDTGNKPSLDNTDAATTYSAPATENPLVAPEAAKPRTRRALADGETGDAPAGGTSNTSTGTETPTGETSTGNNGTLDSTVTERKGATVKPDQPGVNVPKGNEHGAHDQSAHISFDEPDHNATVEEMWKIIQHMPDDFQNNERSYLRNMDTLGNELRFDKTTENPDGVPLKPGEIRELHDFGGWHAIDKDGNKGKFVIGRKNDQGYFTGWYIDKDGKRQEGGMLGADALDNIYVHEQALDRRFNYMLMLVKGRTRANRDETVVDGSKYDPRSQDERAGANYKKLPFLVKDEYDKYSPGVVDYNGIEKTFTAFSTKYGSRVRVDFVTGYITDINGSKGSYRVVIKAKNSKNEEKIVYDETIHRVAEIVQNEELYKKGLDVQQAHKEILKFFKDELNYRANKIRNEKVKANPLLGNTKPANYTPDQKKLYDQIVEEATEEAKKQGDIVMNVTEDFLSVKKSLNRDSEWKKSFTLAANTTIKLANSLNTLMREADKDNPDTPTWIPAASPKAKLDNRAYKLLTTLIPGAKKITYHVNDDQLEVETDKYTYTAARDGSKEVGIQGSNIAATANATTYGTNSQILERDNTNTKANDLNKGWAKSNSDEFKHFSHYIGVDEGIVRKDVISDETLSAKIKEAVGPGYSKLGKPGYFSTADIPLGKDIVSYTVQVIPSDNNRVGVNPQSHRIQYNMPILADFSVIQDTTEPSKELSIRIITKLKEQGKITGEEEKKIKDKIDKAKKTSELRSAMLGNVKVRYVDRAGNVITNIENEKTFGEKDSENRYTAAKDVRIGSDYDVRARAYSTLSTADKYYRLVSDHNGLATGSAATTGTIGADDKVVTFVYEETVKPTTGKGVVHFKKQVTDTTTEALNGYPDISLEGDVGTDFSADSVNDKITELKKAGYEIVSDTFTNGDKTIDSVTDTDGQDPSQVYNVTVREKVVTVTTPPTPNTPVDPTVPDGPKWPETGLAKSDLEKEVTRTITYVKKDTADGPEIADAKPTKKQTAHFKRSVTYNLVTKVVTPGDWGSTDNTLTAVPTEKLEGYIADRASVEAVTVPDTSGNITEKVVYTKLGSWVPNLPKGVTPPEGTDMTPKPYPNHPTDPTKPGDPTPGLIPYVPGYTPNVGGTPLVPKNPTDLTEGYTPPTPTDPKTNIEINYTPDPQKAVVKVYTIRDGVKIELPNEKVSIDSGIPDAAIPSTKLDEKIKDLEKRGYIVDNKTPLKGETFDKVKDSETGDPSQVYELILRERTSVETETKSVTRTIKYYKIDETNGSKVEVDNGKLTNTKTAEFTREVTTNLATGLTTIGAWSDKQTLDEVKTPVLTGYIADKVKVPSSEVTADTESFEEEVVYKKIGNWVPKVPGVENPTPIPYPNDPNDPTKPKYPDYPTKPGNPGETPNPQPGTPDGETPGTPEKPKTPPVIPYVPGYTPKIGDKPLEPVDPNDPTKGYIPPVPTTPGQDTPIEYVADPQKAVVKVFNTTTGTEVELPKEKVELSGKTGEEIPTNSVAAKIADLEKRGYTVENKEPLKGETFDKNKDPENGDPTQVFKLLVKERTVTVTEPKNPNDPVDPDKPEGPKWPATGLAKSDLEKEVTRTITYVKKETANGPEIADAQPTVTQTAHFKRSATYNLVTKVVTLGEWTSTDKELAKVDTPALTGYVADKALVDKVETNADSTGLDQKVVYTKLGSWVPRLPEGVTPPTGTDMTPKPYPNNPTDPTKPGTPVYPEPGQPITPGTPVIPYVPGYTPKIGDKPLEPVDPNHPENGYKVPPVPTTPGNDTPITYEKVPDKPKPETTGTKEVTRTIKYVDEKGNELAKPSTDKVTFTRNGSDWNAVDGDSTFDAVKSPVVKGYILKDSAQKVVEKETVKSDAKDETITVVYTKVGSYVPKVPEGVTPPSPTPYDNDPQDPSKVVTPNPEKPQDPNDPNSPKVPVIPQVPGHTPVVPKDPTKPVSPENPLVPLTPVDPNHPEKGYNVPPVPTIPGQDTPITYVKDGQQKATTSFVDPKGNVLETPITETGDSNTPLTKNGEVEATIAKLKLKGYDVETNTYPPTGTFDNDPKVDQYFKVTLTPRVKPVKPFDPTNPKDPNKPVPGQPIDPDTPVDPNNPNDPTIPRWTEDLINKLETTKQVTRTINYVDEAGNKISKPSTDKVTFTREAKINVVTGEITYGDWKAVGGDSTFDKVSSPVVKGYILKDPAQKEVAERKGVTPTVANQTIEVVYKKLGSWVPKVPGVETPTPLPYPNNPTDPTKPGDPTDPNTPNVPVIPYVPGYTPKTPDGNPLVPKVPNDPTQGYIPPIPTEPGKDTPIEYVKVPNTPSPEEPVKPTPESNHITIWVDENGKPLKPEKPGTHEPGNIPGYRYITTVTKDGVTIHKFEKITPVEPNNPVPQKPTTPIPTPQDPTIPTPESQIPTPNTPEATTPTSETNRREELPNTGTEANASLASAGIMTLLAGLGLGFFKKKEEDDK